MKQKAIICDLDGTLATLDRNPFDFEKLELDELNKPIARILELYDGPVFLVTGREDKYRLHTERWLEKHGVTFEQLYMRRTGDRRKDFVSKEEIYRKHIEPNYDIEFVLEDRDQAVRMWREIGLTCLQVEYGNY